MHAKEGVAVAATVTAVATPLLVVHWGGLGHAIFAQTLTVLLWGVAITAWARLDNWSGMPWRSMAPLLLALLLVSAGVGISAAMNRAPGGVWLGSLGVLAAATAAAICGARAAGHRPELATRALMWGLAIAGVCSLVVAALQLAAPGWANPAWVAPMRTPGRASANLDQPNHLALLLLWSWLAVAVSTAGIPMPRPRGASAASRASLPPASSPENAATVPLPGAGAFAVAFALQAGLVATASRAGLLASMVIALWAALDRRLPRPTAWLLWITALGGLVMTIGRAVMTPAMSLGTSASLVRPGARGGVFMDTVELIAENPVWGVGWMEFQLAWSLSPLGDRGPRYFDHAHNIVMNLAVELGLPLGLSICALLIWGAIGLLRSLGRVPGALQPRARMLAAMLAVIGLQSLFDAPLWYAYLLVPSAWAWGCLVALENYPTRRTASASATASAHSTFGASANSTFGASVPAPSAPGAASANDAAAALPVAGPASPLAMPKAGGRDAKVRFGLAVAGVALAGGAYAAWMDFQRIAPSMLPQAGASPALSATGGGSRLFGYFGDHQRALGSNLATPDVFRNARWVWIDTELIAAWVAALERAGRQDEARYLMQRALEFRDPAHTPWLAACRVVEPLEPPSRCLAPSRTPGWRDFR